jgi:hypothetical protein
MALKSKLLLSPRRNAPNTSPPTATQHNLQCSLLQHQVTFDAQGGS